MEFLQGLNAVVGAVDGFIWGVPLIVILVGTHIYMTIRTRGIQRRIGTGIKLSVKKDPDAEGNISQFGALVTALSATIGTGNIVGVATAIVCGGVGAVFWMWIIGVFGIATKYAETYISVRYRVKDHQGVMLGGAMYALERGFPGKKWAKVVAALFAIFAALASFGIGAAVQSNSICGIIIGYVPAIPAWVIGVTAAILIALVTFGGIKAIARVCEKVIPFMAVFYVICCCIIICINIAYVGPAIKWILVCAFAPKAMIGGGAGFAVASALRYGAARGLFSNESGLGSAPLAAANATTRNPARQALVSMTGTFWDTVIICAITGITLVSTILASPELCAMYDITTQGAVLGQTLAGGFTAGAQLTTLAFAKIPVFGPIVLCVSMVLFGLTTILGWSWYGNRVIDYLFGKKGIKPYQIIFLIFIVLGAIGGDALLAATAWDFADAMNGLMVIPNVIAMWALAGVISKETKHYVYDGNLDEIADLEIPILEDK